MRHRAAGCEAPRSFARHPTDDTRSNCVSAEPGADCMPRGAMPPQALAFFNTLTDAQRDMLASMSGLTENERSELGDALLEAAIASQSSGDAKSGLEKLRAAGGTGPPPLSNKLTPLIHACAPNVLSYAAFWLAGLGNMCTLRLYILYTRYRSSLNKSSYNITVACECHVLHMCMARAAPASCQPRDQPPSAGRWQDQRSLCRLREMVPVVVDARTVRVRYSRFGSSTQQAGIRFLSVSIDCWLVDCAHRAAVAAFAIPNTPAAVHCQASPPTRRVWTSDVVGSLPQRRCPQRRRSCMQHAALLLLLRPPPRRPPAEERRPPRAARARVGRRLPAAVLPARRRPHMDRDGLRERPRARQDRLVRPHRHARPVHPHRRADPCGPDHRARRLGRRLPAGGARGARGRRGGPATRVAQHPRN